jgi:ATP-binding cassette subfamily B (MDR/TAP) protein 9
LIYQDFDLLNTKKNFIPPCFFMYQKILMKLSHAVSIVSSIVNVGVAMFVGIDIPSIRMNELSWFSAIVAYSVYDLAAISLMRTSMSLIRRDDVGKSLDFSIFTAFIVLKIIFRVVTEDIEELGFVDLTDELFYASCVLSFLLSMLQVFFSYRERRLPAAVPEGGFSKVTVSKLIRLALREKWILIMAFLFLIVAAVAQATIPHFIGQALDAVKENKSVTYPLTGLILGAIFCSLFSALRGASFVLLGAKVNVEMRGNLFASILRQDMGFFDKTKTGDLSSRMTQDVQKVCDQVQVNVNYFVRNFIATFVTLSFMIALSWRLTCLSMLSIPLTAVVVHKYGEIMKELSKQVQDRLADCNSASEEAFSNIQTVRSFGAEIFEVERFKFFLLKTYKVGLKTAKMYIPYMTVCKILPYSSTIMIVYYGAKLASAGVIQASILISFVLYLDMLNDTFMAMGDIYASITAALGAADKVFTLLEQDPEFPAVEFPLVPVSAKINGHIQFRNVFFAYPSRPLNPVLQGISLQVKAGTVAAFVGGSGQGKSSCLALVQRWYKESSGEVLLDNVPVRRFDPREYYRLVTCVNQEPILFARTIKENILFGLVNPGDNISDELEQRVIACSKLAHAHTFIISMPEGYDTQVGMRGVQLSGGQKQRIAIARALVRKPKVLLLDEATSALDSESEKQVQSALDSLTNRELTLIVVAHRLSTVRNADVIYVIEKGAVVEQGSHDELVKNESSAYFKLVQNQLSHERN